MDSNNGDSTQRDIHIHDYPDTATYVATDTDVNAIIYSFKMARLSNEL